MQQHQLDNNAEFDICHTLTDLFVAAGLRGGGGNGQEYYHYHYHSQDDGKSAFSVRGVAMHSVSSIEGLAREMATGHLR